MYAGSQLYIRFTCKEKIAQELKEPNPEVVMPRGADIPKGIVKWLVEMFDGNNELVGIATILTMVERKVQWVQKVQYVQKVYQSFET